MVVHNIKYWKQLYNEGKDLLVDLLNGPGGDTIYRTFGAIINAYEPPPHRIQANRRYSLITYLLFINYLFYLFSLNTFEYVISLILFMILFIYFYLFSLKRKREDEGYQSLLTVMVIQYY